MSSNNKKLGEQLLEAGLISSEELEEALSRQSETDRKTGTILLEMGLIDEEELVEFLSRQTGYMIVDLDNYPVNHNALDYISKDQAENYRVVPLFEDEEVLTVAMQDPFDLSILDDLAMITNREIKPAIATSSEIERSIARFYGDQTRADNYDRSVWVLGSDDETEPEELRETSGQTGPVKLVNRTIRNALERNVSNIHIDPRPDKVKILFRIYGEMRHFTDLPLHMADPIISRFEVLAEQSLAANTEQKKVLRLRHGDEDVNLQLNTIATRYGEKMVIQIRRESLYENELSELGFDSVSENRLKSLLNAPRGLILFAGPEDSGKTTTLYTALNYLSRNPSSIVTVEDSVDFELDFCSQIQVGSNSENGKAESIENALRADPDILMVSDVGDSSVTQATLEAAATGRKVLSTIYADNCIDTVYHLTHKSGIDRYRLANSLIGVVSQRLLRIPKQDALRKYNPTSDQLTRLNLPPEEDYYHIEDSTLRKNPFTGITGIYQILPITNQIRRCILEGQEHAAFEKAAESIPLESLRSKGANKVKSNLTTIDEVMRATFREDLTEDFRYPGDS